MDFETAKQKLFEAIQLLILLGIITIVIAMIVIVMVKIILPLLHVI